MAVILEATASCAAWVKSDGFRRCAAAPAPGSTSGSVCTHTSAGVPGERSLDHRRDAGDEHARRDLHARPRRATAPRSASRRRSARRRGRRSRCRPAPRPRARRRARCTGARPWRRAPISVVTSGVVWITEPSCTLHRSRTTIGPSSPRNTAPYQTDAPASIVTSPIDRRGRRDERVVGDARALALVLEQRHRLSPSQVSAAASRRRSAHPRSAVPLGVDARASSAPVAGTGTPRSSRCEGAK